MKDYSKENLECDDPPRDTEHCLTFCLDRLYADRIHTLNDDVVKGLSFEELIGALMSAHRDLTLSISASPRRISGSEHHLKVASGFSTW